MGLGSCWVVRAMVLMTDVGGATRKISLLNRYILNRATEKTGVPQQ
jgi:hypothetical protein